MDPYAQAEPVRVTPYWFPFRYLPFVGQTLGRLATVFVPRTAFLLWLLVTDGMLFALWR